MDRRIDRYQQVEILAAGPIKQVVLLYEGALSALRQAERALRAGDIQARVYHLNKAMAIISELQASLKLDQGQEIARNLARLYAYMQERLLAANIEQSLEKIAEVIKLLDLLRGAWAELARQESETPQSRP